MLMRDAEGRKKEASKVKQTTRQSNTAHPRQSLFQRKNYLPQTEHSTSYIPRQLNWLGPNPTSHVYTRITVTCEHKRSYDVLCFPKKIYIYSYFADPPIHCAIQKDLSTVCMEQLNNLLITEQIAYKYSCTSTSTLCI